MLVIERGKKQKTTANPKLSRLEEENTTEIETKN